MTCFIVFPLFDESVKLVIHRWKVRQISNAQWDVDVQPGTAAKRPEESAAGRIRTFYTGQYLRRVEHDAMGVYRRL